MRARSDLDNAAEGFRVTGSVRVVTIDPEHSGYWAFENDIDSGGRRFNDKLDLDIDWPDGPYEITLSLEGVEALFTDTADGNPRVMRVCEDAACSNQHIRACVAEYTSPGTFGEVAIEDNCDGFAGRVFNNNQGVQSQRIAKMYGTNLTDLGVTIQIDGSNICGTVSDCDKFAAELAAVPEKLYLDDFDWWEDHVQAWTFVRWRRDQSRLEEENGGRLVGNTCVPSGEVKLVRLPDREYNYAEAGAVLDEDGNFVRNGQPRKKRQQRFFEYNTRCTWELMWKGPTEVTYTVDGQRTTPGNEKTGTTYELTAFPRGRGTTQLVWRVDESQWTAHGNPAFMGWHLRSAADRDDADDDEKYRSGSYWYHDIEATDRRLDLDIAVYDLHPATEYCLAAWSLRDASDPEPSRDDQAAGALCQRTYSDVPCSEDFKDGFNAGMAKVWGHLGEPDVPFDDFRNDNGVCVWQGQ